MSQSARTFSPKTVVTLCGAVFIFLLHLHKGSSLATGQLAGGKRTTWGPGGGEEEEEPISIGDRSAQIIKQQDAEEGERWEESAWTPGTDNNINNNINDNDNRNKADTLCKRPKAPEHGYIVGKNYNDGGVVHIFCEVGYKLGGPSNITCIPVPYPGAPGVWLPEDEYRCWPIEPNVIEIRTLGAKDNEAGPSYTILKEDMREYDTGKDEDSKDTETSFQHAVTCPKPTAPQHGHMQGTDYSLYSTVHFLCDEGYNLIGPDHITCLPVPDPFHHVGIWEPQQVPSCHANPPSTLPLILIQNAVMVRTSLQTSGHRLTDTLPDATLVEGLPTECSLPKVVGPCKAAIPRYYFNTTVLECLPFSYGGCQGNENNFETFEDCQKTCR